MYFWPNNTKIVIWGTGEYAKRLFYSYSYKFDIVAFVDNRRDILTPFFLGKKVYNSNYSTISELLYDLGYKILIGSTFDKEIVIQLEEMGFHIGEEFVPHYLFEYDEIDTYWFSHKNILSSLKRLLPLMNQNKKLAILYGNCQTGIIKEYLLRSSEFNKKYIVLTIPKVFEYERFREIYITLFDFNIWNKCDLLITQNVTEHNKFCKELSLNNIIKYVKSDCKIIRITNLFFKGYFIQYYGKNGVNEELSILGRDQYVDNLFKCGLKIEEILNIIKNEDFLEKKECIDFCEKSIKELEEREKEVDVKMADYIRIYYKKKQLFYNYNHPTKFLIKELSRRILSAIGINECFFGLEEPLVTLKGQDYAVYPSVVKNLQIKEMNNEIDLSLSYLGKHNFDDYIRLYVDMVLIKK